MLKIKLARFGKKHQPHYRIVVNEARDKRDGKYTALVGHYTPVAPKELKIDVEAYEAWIKKGAQATETVAALFKRFQSGNLFPVKKTGLSKKAKAKATATAKVAEVAETVSTEKTEKIIEQVVPTKTENKGAEETAQV
jgi:small subunit ribosomal protein S16